MMTAFFEWIIAKSHILTMLSVFVFVTGCTQDRSLVEAIKERKELRVVTRNSPTTYYEGASGPEGLEYDLAKRFARHLGVKLKIVVEDNLGKIFSMVQEGDVDIAAAGLSITRNRQSFLVFGPSYQEVRQQLVYRTRKDTSRPRRIEDIVGADIDVVAHSSHASSLRKLKKKYPELTWHENKELDSEELLELVWSQFIDFTIADSTEISLNQRFMPELAVAYYGHGPQPLGGVGI